MKYKCPKCQTELEWDSKNPNKPFCSERCKNHDLVAWANEENKFAGSPEWDDVMSGEIEAEVGRQQDKLF
ncbi:MAG: DNA gyrase inhibitor YacG [Pseudomonadales bacterium]|nr:DNA gyrase inhibitor YacG [Pseudomonadales bacterium]